MEESADKDVGALGMLLLIVAMGVEVQGLYEIKCFMGRRLTVEIGSQTLYGKKGKRYF